MNIMELFWPKEMKEAAKRLKAEGLLNEEAVQTMNLKTKSSFVIFCIVSAGFILTGSYGVKLFGVAVFLLQPLFIKFDNMCTYRRQMRAYLIGGEKQEAICLASGQSLYGRQAIWYKLASSPEIKNAIIMDGKPKLHVDELPKKDEIFFVYHSADGKRAMPDNEYLKKKYSLTKAIL